MLNSDRLFFFNFVATPVKLLHPIPGNVLQKRVRMFENEQKNKLFWSHSFVFAYRILTSEIFFLTFLCLEDSLVAPFSGKLEHTSRKYLTGLTGRWEMIKNHEFFWLHSYIFILELYPQKLQTMKFFYLLRNSPWLDFVKVVLSVRESIWLNKV